MEFIEYFENGVGKLPIPKIDEESQKPFIKLVDEILEAKQKIKDYKPLLDEAIKNNNFDREIALKKELENLENICTTNEKTIDQMVYKLYDLTPDEIKIVENSFRNWTLVSAFCKVNIYFVECFFVITINKYSLGAETKVSVPYKNIVN